MRRIAVLALLVGCADEPVDKTAMCRFGEQQSAATIQDRKIIGAVAPYAAEHSLAAREHELRTSIAARRQVAWQVVAKVLAPTPLGEPALATQLGGQPTIPAWHTWFARDDFDRVFKKLYRDLGSEARAARAPLDDATIDAGFAWNTQALDEVPEWPEQRYQDYLADVSTQLEAQGLGGAHRVGYSAGAMRHLIKSYERQYACRRDAPPDPFAPQPVRAGMRVQEKESLEVGACEWRVLGPFIAGTGDMRVTTTGDGDADVYVRRGAAPEADAFDCRSSGDASSETCVLAGGGPIYVAVFGATASRVDISIDYLAEDVADPTCLDGEMPRDAVLVKADWRRKLAGENLPYFDTSAARMRERLALGADWAQGDGSANPSASSIYTMTLPSGSEFRLPALHVMTKELDHWLWITLWWSPDPDSDFGADRPASIAALPGPWRNYKMCVATSYVEGDPDPRGGAGGTLGDALASVSREGAPTWCSNPYLEAGAGNAATNCIGCHQHGGTDLTPETILQAMPHHGTTRTRNNFFTDYLWALEGGRGDDLSALIQAEVEYWDATDP
jgi:hypothetical protein